MLKTDWHDVDEFPEADFCNFCKSYVCHCDEVNDAHEVDVFDLEDM